MKDPIVCDTGPPSQPIKRKPALAGGSGGTTARASASILARAPKSASARKSVFYRDASNRPSVELCRLLEKVEKRLTVYRGKALGLAAVRGAIKAELARRGAP